MMVEEDIEIQSYIDFLIWADRVFDYDFFRKYNKDLKEREEQFVKEVISSDSNFVRNSRVGYLEEQIKEKRGLFESKYKELQEHIIEGNVVYKIYIRDYLLKPLQKEIKRFKMELLRWNDDEKYESNSISEEDIENIKENIKIQDIIGTESEKRSIHTLFYKSPFRAEKTGSFAVDLSKNTYYDFGDPSNRGDVISLFMKLNNVSFIEACKQLKTLL